MRTDTFHDKKALGISFQCNHPLALVNCGRLGGSCQDSQLIFVGDLSWQLPVPPALLAVSRY